MTTAPRRPAPPPRCAWPGGPPRTESWCCSLHFLGGAVPAAEALRTQWRRVRSRQESKGRKYDVRRPCCLPVSTRPRHPASIPRTSSSYINAEAVVRPSSRGRRGWNVPHHPGVCRGVPLRPPARRAGALHLVLRRRSASLAVERLSDDPRALRERCRVCAGVVEPEERPGGFGGEPLGSRSDEHSRTFAVVAESFEVGAVGQSGPEV